MHMLTPLSSPPHSLKGSLVAQNDLNSLSSQECLGFLTTPLRAVTMHGPPHVLYTVLGLEPRVLYVLDKHSFH